MIERNQHLDRLQSLLARNPVVALLGPRQVGKTTLARMLAARSAATTHFDLESARDVARLDEPMLALESLDGLVIIDEIQLRPDLFPTLRVLVDRPDNRARFLVLGSASPALLRQGSESLAGRIAFHELPGFALSETGVAEHERLWLRGGFPRSYLAESVDASFDWRVDFIRTFVERDLPQLGITVPAATLSRFWRMLAHVHGQRWNSAELARSLAVAGHTVNRYLDILVDTFAVLKLSPWSANIRKRQVKAPKIYFTDSGLVHALLGIETWDDLMTHPALGASWEGFVLLEIIRWLRAREQDCYYWATHSGAELDLLIARGQQRLGFEIKRTDAPTATRSMHEAIEALELDELVVVHAGPHSFPMRSPIRAVALRDLHRELEPVRKS